MGVWKIQIANKWRRTCRTRSFDADKHPCFSSSLMKAILNISFLFCRKKKCGRRKPDNRWQRESCWSRSKLCFSLFCVSEKYNERKAACKLVKTETIEHVVAVEKQKSGIEHGNGTYRLDWSFTCNGFQDGAGREDPWNALCTELPGNGATLLQEDNFLCFLFRCGLDSWLSLRSDWLSLVHPGFKTPPFQTPSFNDICSHVRCIACHDETVDGHQKS